MQVRVLAGAVNGEFGTITKVDTTGWVHVKMMRRIGGRGSAFIETCRQVQELELVGDEEAENNVVNNGGLDLGNLLYSANLYSDKPDKGDIDGKMVTAYDENAPPTLTSLKSSQWNGTKVKVRTAGKTLGKTVRVFKYGNGWIHATLNMNKPVGDLTIDDDSDICTRANELELIGVKKKEKGKVKGKEAMLGVKEKKKREQELEEMENAGSYWDDGEEEEVSLYANRFIKIGTGAQVR